MRVKNKAYLAQQIFSSKVMQQRSIIIPNRMKHLQDASELFINIDQQLFKDDKSQRIASFPANQTYKKQKKLFAEQLVLRQKMLAVVSFNRTTMIVVLLSLLCFTANSQLNCSAPPNNGINPTNSSQCICLNSSYIFYLSLNSCAVDCSKVHQANLSVTTAPSTGCTCNTGYHWNLTYMQCLPNCSIVTYSNNTLNLTNSSCECLNGYVWDQVLAWCVLPCEKLAYAVSGQLNSSDGTCVCVTNFYFNTTALLCQINCTNITFAAGNSLTGSDCSCIAEYTWNVTLTACVAKNATIFCNPPLVWNANLSQCINCTSPYSYNTTLYQCFLNCSLINFTVNSSQNNNSTCICRSNFYWNGSLCIVNSSSCPIPYSYSIISESCFLNCSLVNYTIPNTVSTNNLSCSCLWPYRWNSARQLCINTQLGNSSGNCSFPYFWNPVLWHCQINCTWPFSWTAKWVNCYLNCSYYPFASGNSTDNFTCPCIGGYIWDIALKECRINCSAPFIWSPANVACWLHCPFVPFSTGITTSVDNVTCACVSQYTWNAAARICVSTICFAPYYWNATNLRCQLNCTLPYVEDIFNARCWLYCKGINNTVTPGLEFSTDNATCLCAVGFVWNSTFRNCSLIQNVTNDTKNDTNITHNCSIGYTWNIRFANCSRDCCSINNSVGNFNSTTCKCRKQFCWNTTSGTCNLNCSSINFTVVSSTNNSSSCQCIDNYVWDSKKLACVPQCPSPFYLDNKTGFCIINCTAVSASYHPSDPSRCVCIAGFFWSTVQSVCISCLSTSGVNSSALHYGDKCVCSYPLFWSRNNTNCLIDCRAVRASTGENDGSGCQCSSGYTWNSNSLYCVKDRYLTLSEDDLGCGSTCT